MAEMSRKTLLSKRNRHICTCHTTAQQSWIRELGNSGSRATGEEEDKEKESDTAHPDLLETYIAMWML